MRRCTYSARALEIFVNDLAGLMVQLSQPRFRRPQHRTFNTRPPYRQLETSQITAERFQNSFVPNGSIHLDANERAKHTAEESGGNLRSLSELDEAWISDAGEATRKPGYSESTHDEFKSAEDMATQAEGVEMKKMARKVKGLEKKRQRKLEGRWAPLKKVNVARRAAEGEEGVVDSVEVEEMSEDAIVAEVLKEPETRRERARRAGKEAPINTSTEKPSWRGKRKSSVEEVTASEKPGRSTKNATGSKAKPDKCERTVTRSGRDPQGARMLKPKEKEVWQVQKASLERKFGEQGWQPKKRLSPDTLEGIRALHNSDPGQYNTETLAKHFSITPEAIRRILKSKWRPNEEEAEDRRQRWEKRGVQKWTEMAELGVKPPSKWRQLGVKSKDHEQKKLARAERRMERKDDRGSGEGEEQVAESFAGRIL